MQPGQLIVITGPSGVGKGTLVKSLLKKHQQLYLSISATTRPPRPGEVDGKDYCFVSRKEFQAMIEKDELLEWAEYAGNYYGTPKKKVEEKIQEGKFVLLEIEVVGARKIKQSFSSALRIFILPPSVTELEHRLQGRGNDSDEVINRRLAIAKEEIAVSHEFDRQIVNDSVEVALAEIESAIFSPSSG